MRTTLDLDDDLLREAEALAPRRMTRTALIEEALRLWLQARAADHLIAAGGSMPTYEPGPRRKPG